MRTQGTLAAILGGLTLLGGITRAHADEEGDRDRDRPPMHRRDGDGDRDRERGPMSRRDNDRDRDGDRDRPPMHRRDDVRDRGPRAEGRDRDRDRDDRRERPRGPERMSRHREEGGRDGGPRHEGDRDHRRPGPEGREGYHRGGPEEALVHLFRRWVHEHARELGLHDGDHHRGPHGEGGPPHHSRGREHDREHAQADHGPRHHDGDRDRDRDHRRGRDSERPRHQETDGPTLGQPSLSETLSL